MQPDETQDLEHLEGPEPLRRVGPYEIESLRRRSETANTYVGRHTRTGTRVRIAVLHAGLSSDADTRERFLRLARLRVKFNHPHLVTGVETGEADGRHYVTMEHPEGRRLSELLRESGALRQAPALGIAMQVARGVRHVHALGVSHGRVKAGHVLVLPNGHAKLGGLASIDMRRLLQDANEPDGPELVVNAAADLYGVGFLVLQMITGDPRPLAGKKPADLQRGGVRLPDAASSHTLQTDTILWRCMSDTPAARFRSLDELEAAMESALRELLPEPAMDTWSATSTVPLAFETDATDTSAR